MTSRPDPPAGDGASSAGDGASSAGVDRAAIRPVPTWVAPAFAVFAVLAVPWVVLMALTLPRHAVAYHYRGAWVGFDIGLVALLAATAYQAWQGRARVAIAATATATMLAVDAWFDVLTAAPGTDKLIAASLAGCVELPLAALCWWLALHAEQVARARIMTLARRAARADNPPR